MLQQNYQEFEHRWVGGMMSQSIGSVCSRHRKMNSQVVPLYRSETLRERKLQIRRKLNQLADEFYKLKYDHQDESRELQNLMQRGEQLSAKVEIVRTKVITDNEKMKESMRKEEEQIYYSPIVVKDMRETRMNTQISPNNSDTQIIVDILQEVEIPLEQRQIQILGEKLIQDYQKEANITIQGLLPQAEKHCQADLPVLKMISLGKSCQMFQIQRLTEKSMTSRRRLFQSHRVFISSFSVLLMLGIVIIFLFN